LEGRVLLGRHGAARSARRRGWNGWGIDPRNSRSQTAAAAGLTAADIPKLKLKWAFGIPGVSASGSQITVVGSRAFVGSRNGVVYALDTKTGCWCGRSRPMPACDRHPSSDARLTAAARCTSATRTHSCMRWTSTPVSGDGR
jgi:outer membrane protein assembly factor BamB